MFRFRFGCVFSMALLLGSGQGGCKGGGGGGRRQDRAGEQVQSGLVQLDTRGLHSSTFRLNISTVCGICLVIPVPNTAQAELRSGRV